MATWSKNGSSVDVLCALCRRELAAIESYRKALSSDSLRQHSASLATCLRSHEERAELLKSRIRAMQGEPPESAGALGTVVRLVEGAAAAISAKAGIFALEEEEDRGLRNYRTHLLDVDSESRLLLEQRLLPAQQETHRIISQLKHGGEISARA